MCVCGGGGGGGLQGSFDYLKLYRKKLKTSSLKLGGTELIYV